MYIFAELFLNTNIINIKIFKKMKTLKFSLLITGLLSIYLIMPIGCDSGNKQDDKDSLKGQITVSGAFALYPMAGRWAQEYMKLYPDVKIDISAGGAGKGMTDALTGMVDIAMVSRDVTPEEIDKGAWHISVTKDAVLPAINAKNPYFKDIIKKGISMEVFKDIYVTGKITDWGTALRTRKAAKINIFTRSDACGAAEMWAKYLGVRQENLLGVGVFGDPGIAEAVRNDKYGIGYNNVIYLYDINTHKAVEGLAVIPVDLNSNGTIDTEENFYGSLDSISNAIMTGKYPSPPARELFFVSKGKPQKAVVIAFLRWILTEGQKYVKEAGYVNLSDERLKEEAKKLDYHD